MNPMLSGMPIAADVNCQEWHTRWEPPKEPFITYEPRDEAWLRYFGLGAIVQTNERAIFKINSMYVMHPNTLRELKHRIGGGA